MELSWSTFILEIINFLVLVWILKRFLYQPVLDIIARRRAGIEEKIADAKRLDDEAHGLKEEYENRLADWAQERQQARDTLAQELNEERNRQLEALQATLSQEREKAAVAASRQQAETARETELRALQQSAQFAARLLSQAAGPELEQRLGDIMLADLAAIPKDKLATLRGKWGEAPESVVVTSVWPVAGEQRDKLTVAIRHIVGQDARVQFDQEAGLLAGFRITIGANVLHANLRHDLAAFAEFAHAGQ